MNLTPESLARHELIGLFAQVELSSDPGLAGLSGQVVDETRNTFLLETVQRVLRIPKKNTSLIDHITCLRESARRHYKPAGVLEQHDQQLPVCALMGR